jgi:hypothetical protein
LAFVVGKDNSSEFNDSIDKSVSAHTTPSIAPDNVKISEITVDTDKNTSVEENEEKALFSQRELLALRLMFSLYDRF